MLSQNLQDTEKQKVANIEHAKNFLPKNLEPIANNEKSIIKFVIDGDISKTFFTKSNKPKTPPSVTLF